ncbi:CHASE domain-containing protein [Myxococcaceae bacterium GXIMD 01537]
MRPVPRRNAAAYLALLVGLVTTLVAALFVQRGAREERDRRFEDTVREGTLSLQQHLDTYLAMLLGARGLFVSSQEVTRQEFHDYVSSLQPRQRFPGILGIGFAAWLRPGEVAAHEARMRAMGVPDFRVWPPGSRPPYASITFLEPLDWRNERVLGYDILSEPVRQEALERALETGLPAASGKVRLVQEYGPAEETAFLLYLPVFHGPPPTTPEERREALRGFVYAPFRMDDLVAGLRFPGFQRTLDLTIHDGRSIARERVLYTSAATRPPAAFGLERTVPLVVAGRPWTLVFTARESFIEDAPSAQLKEVVGGGLLLSLLLFLMTRVQVNARAAAEAASQVQERLAREAQVAVRVRDDFLGVAAHELRTPLTALTLQLQLLRRLLGKEGPVDKARLERGLETSERQTGRLSRLVDSLLDISRLTRGKLELHLEELDLTEVVQEVARRFELEAQSRDVTLTVDAPEPVRGSWDRLRLEQVLTNLVSNALKYGRGSPVDVSVRAEGEGARLEVRDRGIGIAPEDVSRIFERFERAASSRHYGGLGLGLFITRQLVEALGGRISVSSTPEQGSTFTVTLPPKSPAPPLAREGAG